MGTAGGLGHELARSRRHARFELFNFGGFPLGPEPALGNNRSVREENEGLYLQVDFNASLGSLPLRGNAGVRYIQTDQHSVGYQQAGITPVLVEVDRDYDDVLPSVNFVLEVTDEFWVRLGYSEVITRPGLGNLTPGGTISVSGNNRTVTSGNPYLDPFKADAIDTSFEWYFNDEGLLALALFYKDISTFPQSVSETRPFTGNSLGLPDSAAIAACGVVCRLLAGRRLGVHAAVQQRRRRPRGLRDLVSAGFRQRHRSDAELHARDVADRLHRSVIADWF